MTECGCCGAEPEPPASPSPSQPLPAPLWGHTSSQGRSVLGLGSWDKASLPCKLYPAQQRLSSPLGKLAGKRTNPWKENWCPQRVRAGSAGSVSSAGRTQLARAQQRAAGVTAELRPGPRHGAAPRHRGAARPVLVPSPSLPEPHGCTSPRQGPALPLACALAWSSWPFWDLTGLGQGAARTWICLSGL